MKKLIFMLVLLSVFLTFPVGVHATTITYKESTIKVTPENKNLKGGENVKVEVVGKPGVCEFVFTPSWGKAVTQKFTGKETKDKFEIKIGKLPNNPGGYTMKVEAKDEKGVTRLSVCKFENSIKVTPTNKGLIGGETVKIKLTSKPGESEYVFTPSWGKAVTKKFTGKEPKNEFEIDLGKLPKKAGDYSVKIENKDKNMSNKISYNFNAFRKYTVSYNANGGNGAPSKQEKVHGVNLKLSNIKPTRTGYNFTDWNTEKNGTGKKYSAGESFEINANTTLYAQWTLKEKVSIKVTPENKGLVGGENVKANLKGLEGIVEIKFTPSWKKEVIQKFSGKETKAEIAIGTLPKESGHYILGIEYIKFANGTKETPRVLYTFDVKAFIKVTPENKNLKGGETVKVKIINNPGECEYKIIPSWGKEVTKKFSGEESEVGTEIEVGRLPIKNGTYTLNIKRVKTTDGTPMNNTQIYKFDVKNVIVKITPENKSLKGGETVKAKIIGKPGACEYVFTPSWGKVVTKKFTGKETQNEFEINLGRLPKAEGLYSLNVSKKGSTISMHYEFDVEIKNQAKEYGIVVTEDYKEKRGTTTKKYAELLTVDGVKEFEAKTLSNNYTSGLEDYFIEYSLSGSKLESVSALIDLCEFEELKASEAVKNEVKNGSETKLVVTQEAIKASFRVIDTQKLLLEYEYDEEELSGLKSFEEVIVDENVVVYDARNDELKEITFSELRDEIETEGDLYVIPFANEKACEYGTANVEANILVIVD